MVLSSGDTGLWSVWSAADGLVDSGRLGRMWPGTKGQPLFDAHGPGRDRQGPCHRYHKAPLRSPY